MAIYRLRRMSDLESFEVDARDDAHAVLLFRRLLGISLTLEEGPAAPQYMMSRVTKEPRWTKPEDIPVYEIRRNSN